MATKNNLDVGVEAPHHTELSSRYKIEGTVYDLSQIIAAVQDKQSGDDWNARTMGDRLDAIKAYLKSVDAEKVDETENTAGDGETVRDGNDAGGTGTATAVQGDTLSDEDKEALDQVRAGRAAVGPVDTLRAFNQNDEADEVEELQRQQDASQLRGEVQRLRSASTRDKPLHGHVDDLKAPY